MKILEDVRQPIDLVDIYLQDEGFRSWLKDYLYLIDWYACDDQAILRLVNELEPDYYIGFMITCYRSYSRSIYH